MHLLLWLVTAIAAPAGSFLAPYTNQWTVTAVLSQGHRRVDAGVWLDFMAKVTYRGRPALRRTQIFKLKRQGYTTTTINIFDPATLKPLARQFTSSTGDVTLVQFDGSRVTVRDGTGAHRADPQVRTVTESQAFYDFSGGMYGILLAGYPLERGYSGTLTTIGEGDERLRPVPFTVIGLETVPSGMHTRRRAWHVRALWTDSNPLADSTLDFWITKQAPYIIRLVYDSPKLGRKFVFTCASRACA